MIVVTAVSAGVIRRCREAYKIAPLVAGTKAVATLLYAAPCSRVPDGDAVHLDVPLPSSGMKEARS